MTPLPSDADFKQYMETLRLRSFKADELTALFHTERGGVRNAPPEEGLWKNIAPTLLVLDALRQRMNAPIRITSAYRSPAYNAAVGGAPASLHTAFCAIDFTLLNGENEKAAETLLNWQGKRFHCPFPVREAEEDGAARLGSLHPIEEKEGWRFQFLGGVGYYRAQQFVHIDTRGRRAVWADTPALMERAAEEARKGMRALAEKARAMEPFVARRASALAEKALAALDAENAPPAARKGAVQKLAFLISLLENKSDKEAEAAMEEMTPLWPFL